MSKPAPLVRLVVLALLAACASKKPPDPAVDAPVAIDAPGMPVAAHLIDRAASSICGALFRCCDDDLVTYFGPFRENELLKAFRDRLPPAATLDETSCKQVVGEMFQIVPFGDWVHAVDAGDVKLDAAAFDRCTAALDHATCGESMRAALWDSSCLGFAPPSGGAAQRSFVHRTQGAGAACKPIRDGVGAAFYGTCDPATTFCCYADPAQPGCRNPFDAAGTARRGTCQTVAALGQTCAVTPPLALCATGQDCDSGTATCIAPETTALTVGATCIDPQFNQLGICQDSWCDVLGTSKCTALRDDGTACSSGDECRSQQCQTTCVPNTLCTGPTMTVDGALDAGVHDAALPDAASPDAALPDAAHAGDGERCATALNLIDASTASPLMGYTSRIARGFGTTDDYNPLMSSGLPPHCAFAYNAIGNELVYALTLQPGDRLKVHAELADGKQAGVYLLDQCPAAHWPDWDRSGACGSNEYAVGSCGITGCDPAVLDTVYPTMIGGQMTSPATFWLVVDQVGGADSTGFVVDWAIQH